MGIDTKYAPVRGFCALLVLVAVLALGACSEGSLEPDSFDRVSDPINGGDGRAFHAAILMGDELNVLLLGGQGAGGVPLSGVQFAERIRCASCGFVPDPGFDAATPRVNPVALPFDAGAVVAGGQGAGVNSLNFPLPPEFLSDGIQVAVTGAEYFSQVGTGVPIGTGVAIPSPSVGGANGATMVAVGADIFLMGGRRVDNSVSNAVYQLGADGSFSLPVGTLFEAREGHTATALADGSVLIVGGFGAAGLPLGSAEIFDPINLSSSLLPGGPLLPRALHTATASRDGCSVLIFGGVSNAIGGLAADVEHFRSGAAQCPDNFDRFEFVVMPVGISKKRLYHTATRLNNGEILIVGGVDSESGSVTGSALLFTPATGAMRPSNDALSFARYGHSATVFTDGGVLIAGGLSAQHEPVIQAERYFGGL